jgi:hypothetical protein
MADAYTASKLAHELCGADCDTKLHKPRNTGEALVCMSKELQRLYADNDDRAIFLRAYFIMTTQVNASVHGTGDFKKSGPIFFDPTWVDRLAGRFALLYFQSLAVSREDPPGKFICEAWGVAMRATKRRSSVLQNLMLGINAHINFDLSLGIHDIVHQDLQRLQARMEPRERDRQTQEIMARWKFDHDQMNNVLVRCNPKIQEVLVREFGGVMGVLSKLCGMFDELISIAGLRYYRDRVWQNVLGLLSASQPGDESKVRMRLGWESLQMAEFLVKGGWLNDMLYRLDSLCRRRSFKDFRPDLDGEISAGDAMGHRLQRPF